jgi:hypothetical protein
MVEANSPSQEELDEEAEAPILGVLSRQGCRGVAAEGPAGASTAPSRTSARSLASQRDRTVDVEVAREFINSIVNRMTV